MLTPWGRRARLLGTLVVIVAVVAGTVVGEDDHFPFGPFRMYSTTTSDRVTVLLFEGVDVAGEPVTLRSSSFGLRPAEMHGQLARYEGREEVLLAHLVEAYERLGRRRRPLRELRAWYGVYQLDADGALVGYERRPIAYWSAE